MFSIPQERLTHDELSPTRDRSGPQDVHAAQGAAVGQIVPRRGHTVQLVRTPERIQLLGRPFQRH